MHHLIGRCVAVAACWTAAAAAAEDLHLDLEVGTDLPVALGVTAAATWPSGLRASTSLGYLPGSYVALINAVAESFPDSYDEATGDLIEDTLQSSIIWRTHVGYLFDFGLYTDIGYGLATLGGGTSTEALLAALAGAPSGGMNSGTTYDIGSTLHMIDVEVGWKTVFAERWTFRTGLGFAGTLAASATVEANTQETRPGRQQLVSEFESFTEDYLVDTYTSYVFTPVVTVALGYRLF